tara:strand:+ start:16490 stop:17167 length:678 start_codon:yes stop_codon:yes gene_type:complete
LTIKKTIAIIPARGNSKRFPNKNLAKFDGQPLISHSINYAKVNNDYIDEIYVTTNDYKIAQIAEANGAKVVIRPESLSGDLEPTVTALRHVLQSIDFNVENVILLQPTNPLRPQNLISDCFGAFTDGAYDSAMTVTRNHQKFGKIIEGKFVPFNYNIGQRSQDLDPLYFENGLLYIIKAHLVLEKKIIGEKNLPFIVNHPYAEIDIDTKEDLELAELYLSKFKPF